MNEKYRPVLHLTPDSGWMNDPNGLVYFNGRYHQFYQYYPHDTIWGPMHWGHKISEDLLHWEELPVALSPDESGMCFSGSALVDWHNRSGLFENGKPGLLAFYTSFLQPQIVLADGSKAEDPIQQQSLAYSQDGLEWHKYQGGRPVIPARGNPDFRDPKVFWHPASEGYVMVVSCGQHIEFYRSDNLLDWQLVSEFGYRHGAHSKGPWECPDLFELQLEGSDERRWVLVVGIGEGAHCEGAGTQYFIGDFDGYRFSNQNHPEQVLWLDYGRDYYATQSFSDVPESDGRRIVSTWMSNHQYSLELPTKAFRSSMAMPRELFLFESGCGLRVGQRFIRELGSCLTTDVCLEDAQSEQALVLQSDNPVCRVTGEVSLEKGQTVTLSLFSDGDVRFEFCHSDEGLEVRSLRWGQFGCERIDRHYPHDYRCVLPADVRFHLDVFIDNGSVELLINHGQFSFTNLAFAADTTPYVCLRTDSGTLPVRDIKLASLQGEEAC